MYQKSIQSFILTLLMLLLGASLSACNSNDKPPELMKAVKQFDTDKQLQSHLSHIRKDHMHLLLHKRDETVIKGIRTKKNSLKACINCHVPEQYNGKVLRHTNPKHFCSTCHGYVAAQLDCFQCHVDHPSNSKTAGIAPKDAIHENTQLSAPSEKYLPSTVAELKNTPKQVIGDK